MPHRVEKTNALIQKILAQMIAKEFCASREIIISVTRVEATANLQEAKVYISVFPNEKRPAVVSALNRQIISFQKYLNKQLRMRPIPRILFVQDTKPEKAQTVEAILESIKGEKQD